jgi:glutamine cyclotransferase
MPTIRAVATSGSTIQSPHTTMAAKKRKNLTRRNQTLASSSEAANDSNGKKATNQEHPPSSKRPQLPMVVSFLVVVAAIFFGRHYLKNPSDVAEEQRITAESATNRNKWNDFGGIATITKGYKVLKVRDHDPSAFTQGLQVHNDQLVESIGNYGESLIRIWDPETGKVFKETPILDKQYFGEGLTYYQDEASNDRYVLLTWKEKTAFIYDTDLNLLESFQYETETNEGWGITFDPTDKLFYVSDGSAYIHVWNLQFQEIRKFVVTFQLPRASSISKNLNGLNELEWNQADGTILANVWYQNIVVRIWPATGQVVQIYNLSDLYTDRSPLADCLNGIAHQGANRWWLTGKLWPHLYLVEFLE